MSDVYVKKENGRYEKIGQQFDGFPADGWWVVADGRKSLVVPIEEPRPLEKLSYLQYRNEIVDRLLKDQKTYNCSFNDLVGHVLSELEELVSEKN